MLSTISASSVMSHQQLLSISIITFAPLKSMFMIRLSGITEAPVLNTKLSGVTGVLEGNILEIKTQNASASMISHANTWMLNSQEGR